MAKNKFLLLSASLIVAVGMSACSGSSKKTSEQQETETVVEEVSVVKPFIGTYEGTLPCADCDGNKVTLSILEDGTYQLKNVFLGKEDNNFEECGTYEENNGIIVLVTPSSGNKTYYKVQDNSVVMCDSEGNVNQGELADMYVLKKN